LSRMMGTPSSLGRRDMLHHPFLVLAFFSGFVELEQVELVRIGW